MTGVRDKSLTLQAFSVAVAFAIAACTAWKVYLPFVLRKIDRVTFGIMSDGSAASGDWAIAPFDFSLKTRQWVYTGIGP